MTPAGRDSFNILNYPYLAYGETVTPDEDLIIGIKAAYDDRLEDVGKALGLAGKDATFIYGRVCAAVFFYSKFIEKRYVHWLMENFPILLAVMGNSFHDDDFEKIGDYEELRQNIYLIILFYLASKYDEWDPLEGIRLAYLDITSIDHGDFNETFYEAMAKGLKIYYHFNPYDTGSTRH